LFGTTPGEDEQRFRKPSRAACVREPSDQSILPLPMWVPTRANRAARATIATMDEIVHKIIDRRRRGGDGAAASTDLLGMLIEARDEETEAAMDDRQLRDEVITFLVAGHETTAVTLSWTWHLLASHPEVEARLFAEVDEVLGGRTPALGDLENLGYTKRVVQEAMRLYPPAWALSRQSYQEDQIRDRRVPANCIVTISPYLTHRHPQYWPDPERFDPERFSPEASAGRPEYAYFPFGGGPRRCIGSQFAMMEAQLILAMTAQRFRLVAVPGHRVEKDPILTLRPKPGVLMHLERRGQGANIRLAPAWGQS
jgi:cytochrome P450